MRPINEIINELMQHPDYIHHEIWTLDNVIWYMIADYNLDMTDDVFDVIKPLLTKDDIEDFEDFLYNSYNSTFEYNQYDYPEDLDRRINREIKLFNLLS